jgi:hypothetical protein
LGNNYGSTFTHHQMAGSRLEARLGAILARIFSKRPKQQVWVMCVLAGPLLEPTWKRVWDTIDLDMGCAISTGEERENFFLLFGI